METTLHHQLKAHYAATPEMMECRREGYRIDAIDEDGGLVEIQTGNFGAIRPKLRRLIRKNQVKLVYPICQSRVIAYVDTKTGKVLSRRKSPKKGMWTDVFRELVYLAEILPSPNLQLELLLTEEEERRTKQKQTRRRHRQPQGERRLLKIQDRKVLCTPEDYLSFIPPNIPTPFTTRGLATIMGLNERLARQVVYCLREMKLIDQVGKLRNHHLYVLAGEQNDLDPAARQRIELRELRRADWQKYESRLQTIYGDDAAAILEMEEHLAELSALLRDEDPARAAVLLHRESARLARKKSSADS